MKKYFIFFKKVFIIFVTCVWLVGCATHSSNGEAGSDEKISGNSVSDPAVQSVINSGKINAPASEIEDMIKNRVYYFKLNSDEINSKDKEALKALALLMQYNNSKEFSAMIEGHTDKRGTGSYNLGLGLKRAKAVKKYLMVLGVTKSQLKTTSYGFMKPADPQNNPVAWAKNRRVEIILKDNKDS